jgi:hypothetical protein
MKAPAMMKSMLAATLAGALALSTAATPAAANDRDAARVILGLGALAALGIAIANADDHHKPRVVTRYRPLPPRYVWRHDNKRHHDWRHDGRRDGHHRDRDGHRDWRR